MILLSRSTSSSTRGPGSTWGSTCGPTMTGCTLRDLMLLEQRSRPYPTSTECLRSIKSRKTSSTTPWSMTRSRCWRGAEERRRTTCLFMHEMCLWGTYWCSALTSSRKPEMQMDGWLSEWLLWRPSWETICAPSRPSMRHLLYLTLFKRWVQAPEERRECGGIWWFARAGAVQCSWTSSASGRWGGWRPCTGARMAGWTASSLKRNLVHSISSLLCATMMLSQCWRWTIGLDLRTISRTVAGSSWRSRWPRVIPSIGSAAQGLSFETSPGVAHMLAWRNENWSVSLPERQKSMRGSISWLLSNSCEKPVICVLFCPEYAVTTGKFLLVPCHPCTVGSQWDSEVNVRYCGFPPSRQCHSDYQVDQVRENKFTGWRGLRGTGDKFWPMQS